VGDVGFEGGLSGAAPAIAHWLEVRRHITADLWTLGGERRV
jgi:hypothetical protein